MSAPKTYGDQIALGAMEKALVNNYNFGTRGLTGIAALFALCWGAGSTAHAQVLVSDFNGSGGISEYSFSGTFLRTFVASGSGGLSQPSGMTFGASGNLYVSAYGNNAIKKYDGTTGAYLT